MRERLNNAGTAYVLWLGCLLQLYGLQRLYNGKVFTGLLWLCTFGLFGFGQLLDLILIPGMVDEYNAKVRASQGILPPGTAQPQPVIEQVVHQPEMVLPSSDNAQQTMLKLLKAAEARGGRISVTQGVLDTGAHFNEVEAILRSLLKTGYVEVTNDPETGVVMYEFREL